VTNYDEPHLRKAAAEAGAYAFVNKEDLWQINRIIEKHKRNHDKKSS